jgi:DNA-binding transcriptional regulator YiaG
VPVNDHERSCNERLGNDLRPQQPRNLAQRIVEAREAIGLTTAQLAHRLGVRTATLASWEQGKASRAPTG